MDVQKIEAEADQLASVRQFAKARDLLEQLSRSVPELPDIWVKLASMQIATGDPKSALQSTEFALKARPLDFSCLLMRANLLERLGRKKQAGEAYGRAVHNAPSDLPERARQALTNAKLRYREWQNSEKDRLLAAVSQKTQLTSKLIALAESSLRIIEPERSGPTNYCYPGLGETEFFDTALFPWAEAVEAATVDICAEFQALLESQQSNLLPYIQYPENVPLHQWKALNNNNSWRAAHLFQNGSTIEENVKNCPITAKLLSSLPQPEIPDCGPNAMFSLLAPHTHIPPHTGINNARLVCHLPLVVPDGCWFRVGSQTRAWEPKKLLIFDDTIEHEAMNPSGQLRVVLIFDIWHPALDDQEKAGISAMIAADERMLGL
jgi:Aspartyl/Asparaginyl beta-hydroxylase/Tetratricopeptide repeat